MGWSSTHQRPSAAPPAAPAGWGDPGALGAPRLPTGLDAGGRRCDAAGSRSRGSQTRSAAMASAATTAAGTPPTPGRACRPSRAATPCSPCRPRRRIEVRFGWELRGRAGWGADCRVRCACGGGTVHREALAFSMLHAVPPMSATDERHQCGGLQPARPTFLPWAMWRACPPPRPPAPRAARRR